MGLPVLPGGTTPCSHRSPPDFIVVLTGGVHPPSSGGFGSLHLAPSSGAGCALAGGAAFKKVTFDRVGSVKESLQLFMAFVRGCDI